MTIGGVYFVGCALFCLTGALITVLARNPIRGAMGLLTTIVGIAGLFLQLDAQFLAAIQLIVYAGAVVVLFVFSMLLMGADAIDPPGVGKAQIARIIGAFAMLAVVGTALYLVAPDAAKSPMVLPVAPLDHGTVARVGQQLFKEAVVPFEISTALLIVAVVGAIAVARGKHAAKARRAEPNASKRMFGGPVHPRDAGRPIVKGVES
jgi:NADH-quinone oxidoreductase subunit J